ncbi:MAG: NAD(P)H-quinone oxidoreductase [Balneolaceae bacterium]
MKAIIVKQPGGAEQLTIVQQRKPEPKEDEILIKVKASAINRTDIITREKGGGYLETPILGIEVAGVVERAGAKTNIALGTRVMGLVNGGGYAQYAVMPANRAIEIPDNISFEQAAAITEVFLTAYQCLYWHGRLAEKETVLIHAGGSGVGTAAIQLAKQFSNAKVITTAGSEEKLVHAKKIGADFGINYKEQDFAEEVLKITENRGVDVILDFVGASYWEKNYQSISIDGRWILIGLLGGAVVERVNLFELMSKRVQLTGTLLTPRSDEYKAELTKEFAFKTMPYFENGKLIPIIDCVYSFEQIRRAHERMQANANIGKIILQVAD